MLRLGDVLIREEEVVSVAWRGDRLRLVLRWELDDVPVLLDLPPEMRLSWWAGEDPEAGILVKLDGWRFSGARLNLLLAPGCL